MFLEMGRRQNQIGMWQIVGIPWPWFKLLGSGKNMNSYELSEEKLVIS